MSAERVAADAAEQEGQEAARIAAEEAAERERQAAEAAKQKSATTDDKGRGTEEGPGTEGYDADQTRGTISINDSEKGPPRTRLQRTGDFFKGVGGRIAGGFKRIYKIIGNHYGKLIGLGLIVVLFIAGFSGDFDDKSDSTKTNSSTGSSTKSGTGSSTSTATQNSSTDDEDPDNDDQTSSNSGYIKYILIGLGVALVIGIIILSTSHKKAKPVTHSSAPGFSDNMSSYPQGMSDLDFMD